ncbi:MAG: hypothetical protein CSYNP_03138 [Syntrophus sp. SKADARSKE-3]|nr:hypothetical protein [Syntrophus sp. SKADARSKE-3]
MGKSWGQIFIDQIFSTRRKRKEKFKKSRPTVIIDHNGEQLYHIDRKGKKTKYKKYR